MRQGPLAKLVLVVTFYALRVSCHLNDERRYRRFSITDAFVDTF